MVKHSKQAAYRIVPLALFGMISAFGVGCSGGDDGDEGVECSYNDPAGPDCSSCQQLNQCCEFSINCPAGAICNLETDPLFDPNAEVGKCLKVVCQGDGDCEAPKTCSLEKLCKPPVCQNHDECPGGQSCLSGTCMETPDVSDVASCEVVTRSTSLREGATLELSAVARNANGAVLPTIPFEWTSANPNVVSVEGNVATGGSEDGTTDVTAAVMGASVTCDGSVSLTNFPNLQNGEARVVLVADDDGSPVAGATVVFEAGGTLTATTAADGSATVNVAGAVDSITVVKEGWQFVSVLEPGTNDIFLPLPRVPDETVAGGFRGKVDLSATRNADIQLGIAGPAIPSNLLDFGLESLIGDSVNTVIDAPELGLDMEEVDLPGGVMLGLGTKKFTVDGNGVRCQGDSVGDQELGCFLARAPKGPSAGWVLAGQLKLSQVTSIANELSNALGGGGAEDIQIGSILTAVLPLVRSLNHGILPSLNIEEYPKVNTADGSGDCSDPDLADYDANCEADFTKYQKADMAASQSLNVLSKVTVPDLPNLPSGGGCAAGAILLSGVNLQGRGLVPLGLTAGIDVLDDEAADCRVAGVDMPFGDNSPKLDDGVMPLSMAAPHSGVEGSQLFVLLLALDPNEIADTNTFQLNAIVNRVDQVSPEQSIQGSYLSYPKGTFDRTAGTVTLDSAISGAQMARIEIQRGDDTWLIYAPGNSTNITLPNVARPRQVLQSNYVIVLGMGMNGTYDEIWSFGSGKTLDRMFDTANAFVVQQCSTDAGSACVIQ